MAKLQIEPLPLSSCGATGHEGLRRTLRQGVRRSAYDAAWGSSIRISVGAIMAVWTEQTLPLNSFDTTFNEKSISQFR